jgi:hypothetical protein
MIHIRVSRLLSAAAVMTVLAFFSLTCSGQTPTRRTPAKPSPTATPPSGEAEIISTAADQNEPNYVGQPVQKQPVQQDDANAQRVRELTARVKKLEAAKGDPYENKQRRLLLNLDILTRAEQRSESLRKQLFDMLEKETTVAVKLDQIEFDLRPEMISRSAAYSSSMRPEEVREMRKKSLDAEKQNLQSLLTEIQNTRTSLTANLTRSDALVEKLRTKLEADIDNAFKDDEPDK